MAGEGRRAGPPSAISPPRAGGGRGVPPERPGCTASSRPGGGFRTARRAAPPPRGAQSPAPTQPKAGVAALPGGRRRRPHSPAEVIMAAPRTRPPARSPPWPRRVSVSSGPARFAGASWFRCPAWAVASGRRPASHPGPCPPRAARDAACRLARILAPWCLCLPGRRCRPASRAGMVHGELQHALL